MCLPIVYIRIPTLDIVQRLYPQFKLFPSTVIFSPTTDHTRNFGFAESDCLQVFSTDSTVGKTSLFEEYHHHGYFDDQLSAKIIQNSVCFLRI